MAIKKAQSGTVASKNLKDASQNKNMKPIFKAGEPSGPRAKTTLGGARTGKTVKKSPKKVQGPSPQQQMEMQQMAQQQQSASPQQQPMMKKGGKVSKCKTGGSMKKNKC